MTDEYIKTKMLKFLEVHYPVSRIKHEARFKRGIMLDGGEAFFLNDKSTYLELQVKLFKILTLVFDSNEKITLDVLTEFLYPKLRMKKTS